MIKSLINPLLNFVRSYYPAIISVLTAGALFYFVYVLTTGSLKKLKTAIFSTYPFDLFFPHEGTWSVGYFLLVILALGLLIYLLMKGNFVLSPA